jgi:Mg-chelatase subunit ChlD
MKMKKWLTAFCTAATLLLTLSAFATEPGASEAKDVTSEGKTVAAGRELSILPEHKHTKKCKETSEEPALLVCILDRSGSMRDLAKDTIGGYNSFLEKQRKEPGEAAVTTVLFDDKYELVLENEPLAKAPEMTSETYYARGMTALLDAVGRTIMDTAGRMEKEGICPAKRRVVFLIMTDGLENASREYDRAAVRKMISDTTERYHWQYVFLGANIDSVAEAQSIGISSKNAANYEASGDGVQDSFARMSAAASAARAGGDAAEALEAP